MRLVVDGVGLCCSHLVDSVIPKDRSHVCKAQMRSKPSHNGEQKGENIREGRTRSGTFGDVLDLPGGGIGEEPFGDLRLLPAAELLGFVGLVSSVRHWRGHGG
ncbi:hypothetical protein B296_00031227 [Ensete ventricosum]|uniref:Uncharacterized protein n=1 Tax=Ensete ventricosum TaxID=4639 RepID=A0A426XZW2_ENSVE|nr:hypothetical protein B296_00031227 [Ensete ventricosum]